MYANVLSYEINIVNNQSFGYYAHARILKAAGCQPPENREIIVFLSNTDPDPPKNHKATKPAMLDHHWHASETSFKWHFVDRTMIARLLWYLDPLPHHKLINNKNNNNKALPELNPL